MKKETKILIFILFSIIIIASILITYFESLVLKINYEPRLFLINYFLILLFFIVILSTSENTVKYKPKRKIKIGLDIHGCIDHDPVFFSELSRTLVALGHEVHITTGSFITDEIIKELKEYNMEWTHLWSISDYYKNKPGIEMWFDKKGRPWVDEQLWNMAKGDYAKRNQLDLCIDDTDEYKKFFSTSIAICNIINKSGILKKEKAKMPPRPNN
jgi:hypothetical protein